MIKFIACKALKQSTQNTTTLKARYTLGNIRAASIDKSQENMMEVESPKSEGGHSCSWVRFVLYGAMSIRLYGLTRT